VASGDAGRKSLNQKDDLALHHSCCRLLSAQRLAFRAFQAIKLWIAQAVGKTILDKLVSSLLIALNEPVAGQTTHEVLQQAAETLQSHFAASVVVAYELIPETEGVPRFPPICIGALTQPEEALHALHHGVHCGMLADFIRHGRFFYEANASTWFTLTRSPNGRLDYAHFIAIEKIQCFLFLPLYYRQDRLAAIFLNYRQPHPLREPEQKILEACATLISARLAQISHQPTSPQEMKKQVALAHTLYGGIAVIFRGQLDALELEIRQALGDNIPAGLAAQLATARGTVFEVMRNLVIEASGYLLVDLKTMPLAKALNTATAALRRAWPPGQRVTIDIPPIPLAIEQQPYRLRQLLYAFILEALGNAIKHGGPAPYINIDLSWADDHIYVQVIDHGKGFDRQAQPFSEYGLGFWQAYIGRYLAGAFEVSSQPGYGAVVWAKIPVIPPRIEHDDATV
jgi:signal transduction histidine kinase